MVAMKALSRLCLLPLLAVGVAACDSGPLLRDNYLGQSILEPDLRPRRVQRDEQGNPILQADESSLADYWRQLMSR